ncbi:MAG TPA: flagellin A2, partial [Euryarchaeota archaeon]|nr:flagellin A2 [Euryarchaeota archaeon]
MRRGDMGIATLIIFVVIILVATVAAVVIIQAANAARTQAQGTSEESRSKIG